VRELPPPPPRDAAAAASGAARQRPPPPKKKTLQRAELEQRIGLVAVLVAACGLPAPLHTRLGALLALAKQRGLEVPAADELVAC
jgi:hypothetical protein